MTFGWLFFADNPPPLSFLGMATKFSKGKLAEVQAKKAKTGLKEGLLSKRHCKDDKSSKGEDPMVTSNVVMLNLPSSILLHPHCLWSWLPLSTRVRKLGEGKNWHLVPSRTRLIAMWPRSMMPFLWRNWSHWCRDLNNALKCGIVVK